MKEFERDVAAFNKLREEESRIAKPWEQSTASIALAALENLNTNDVADAKFKLAALVAIYYRGYSRDGDTNLLTSIESFAAKDRVLSNAIYRR